MNKKSLILVAALAIALVGCGKKEESNVPVVGEQQAPAAEVSAPAATPAPVAPVAPVATPAPVAAQEAPAAMPAAPAVENSIPKSTLEVSNESAPVAPAK